MHDPAMNVTPRRRPRRILAMAAVVMVAGMLLVGVLSGRAIGQAKTAAKKQTATVVLRVMSQAPSLLPEPHADRENDAVFLNTQLALIKSEYVIVPALRSPRVANLPIVKQQDDPATWLEGLLKVEVVPNTELVKISITSPEPSLSVTLVNVVVETYLVTVVEDQH